MTLGEKVQAMNTDNFIVRPHRDRSSNTATRRRGRTA